MVEERAIAITQRLVMQGEDVITVPVDGVPVLGGYTDHVPSDHLIHLVHFLRAGCPAAQLVITRISGDWGLGDVAREERTAEVTIFLDALALPGEKFVVSIHHEANPYVLLIERRVADKGNQGRSS